MHYFRETENESGVSEESAPRRKQKSPSGKRSSEAEGTQSEFDKSIDSRKLARRGLRIARTNVGKGVFATKPFARATCIGEIEGDIYTYDSWESRYSFDLEDGRQLEPKPPFRFVNHSCTPNCNFDLVDFASNEGDAKDLRILLYATHDIRVGEELTIDYNWPKSFAIPCKCKSERCRGWIVDPAQLPFMPHP